MIISEGAPKLEELRGVGFLMASALRASCSIPILPKAAKAVLLDFRDSLPPQSFGIPPRHRLSHWIRAAALLEAHALWDATWEVLTLLQERCAGNDPESRAHCALLSARLGRVARVRGELDDAERWYEEAYRLSGRLPKELRWIDARPHALLGLCVLNVGKGNYPKAADFARRVIRGEAPDLYLVQAYLVSALIARKRNDPYRALSNLWKAHDLVPRRDPRHTDLLITLAETASELGFLQAATRARLAALARARTPRLAAAALAGLLQLAAKLSPQEATWMTTTLSESAWGRSVAHRLKQPPSRFLLLVATQGWLADANRYGLSPDDQIFLYHGAIGLALTISSHGSPEHDAWIEHSLTTLEALVTRQMAHEWKFRLDDLRVRVQRFRVSCSS